MNNMSTLNPWKPLYILGQVWPTKVSKTSKTSKVAKVAKVSRVAKVFILSTLPHKISVGEGQQVINKLRINLHTLDSISASAPSRDVKKHFESVTQLNLHSR